VKKQFDRASASFKDRWSCVTFICATDTEAFEFSDVCKYHLGRAGEWLAIIFGLTTFIGGMMAYWVLMSNFLYVTGIFIRGGCFVVID